MQDELYMQRCIDLAYKGRGKTGLNPLVGAVLVHNNRIIGEGWHKGFGKQHAEPDAIASVRSEDLKWIKESTLYVSLEPCSHLGKTPPCTDLIFKHQIPKVVIGSDDPNPKVNGTSIKKMVDQGVKVVSGVLSKKTDDLIKVFKVNQLEQRPFVTIKFARTIDGFIGREVEAIRISDPITDFFSHRLRTEVGAIAVGRNTSDIDQPQLTARKFPGCNPIRIIFISSELPELNSITFDKSAPTFIAGPKNLKTNPELQGSNWFELSTNLKDTISKLYSELQIGHLLVEGGSKLIGSFLKEGLYDEIYEMVADRNLQSGVPVPTIPGQTTKTVFRLKRDRIIHHRIQSN